MNCLIDYVGISGCNRPAPDSGLYINSLPGMSVKNFSMLTDEESPTFLNVWDDIQLRASKRFLLDVYSDMSKRYKIMNIPSSVDLGRQISSLTGMAAEYRGFIKDLDYGYDDNWKKSALNVHYIQTLSFYSPIVSAGFEIKIFDFDLLIEIDSFTFDAVIGWNVIQVNNTYSQRRIFVCYDATTIDSKNLIIPNNTWDYCDTVQGMSSSFDLLTFEKGNNSFGLSAVMGSRCKWDALVCNNLDHFAVPFWYLLGVETMVERIASNRLNFVTVDRKQSDELKLMYEDAYFKSLSQACQLELDESDLCLDCNQQITVRETNSFFA